jgi:hypothetical protein
MVTSRYVLTSGCSFLMASITATVDARRSAYSLQTTRGRYIARQLCAAKQQAAGPPGRRTLEPP